MNYPMPEDIVMPGEDDDADTEAVDQWPCLTCGEPVERRDNPILGGPYYIHSSQIDMHFPVRSPGPDSPFWKAERAANEKRNDG